MICKERLSSKGVHYGPVRSCDGTLTKELGMCWAPQVQETKSKILKTNDSDDSDKDNDAGLYQMHA